MSSMLCILFCTSCFIQAEDQTRISYNLRLGYLQSETNIKVLKEHMLVLMETGHVKGVVQCLGPRLLDGFPGDTDEVDDFERWVSRPLFKSGDDRAYDLALKVMLKPVRFSHDIFQTLIEVGGKKGAQVADVVISQLMRKGTKGLHYIGALQAYGTTFRWIVAKHKDHSDPWVRRDVRLCLKYMEECESSMTPNQRRLMGVELGPKGERPTYVTQKPRSAQTEPEGAGKPPPGNNGPPEDIALDL